jgi:hypothetical protein
MVLSEAFQAAMSFKDFFTIKHPEWYDPKYDKDSTPYPIYDTYDDTCMIVPKYDKDWAFEKLLWDMDPSSYETCMEDDKGEVDFGGDNAHESHHLTGQCTVSTCCMASSSELVVVDGDNILSDESKYKNPLCDQTTHTILMKLNKEP